MTGDLVDVLERIAARTVRFIDCDIFNGSPGSIYGRITVDGREQYVHRAVFERAFGPIPEGMVVDHICFTTKCVRPEHLQLLDRNENANRRRVDHHNAVKTHCPRGHAYTTTNTYVYRGRRSCRACHAPVSSRAA